MGTASNYIKRGVRLPFVEVPYYLVIDPNLSIIEEVHLRILLALST